MSLLLAFVPHFQRIHANGAVAAPDPGHTVLSDLRGYLTRYGLPLAALCIFVFQRLRRTIPRPLRIDAKPIADLVAN
ncbi:UNVERIFIED_ORG: hypothetical protein LHK14_26760 (plasmid) [Roseateles sp. XES5]|nr:hypothetical protein [Roseateles sp. XES5]